MEDLAVKVVDVRNDVQRLYDAIDSERRKQGLPVPYYRSITVFEPSKKQYRICCNGISLFVVSDRMRSDDELYDYVRYARVIGDFKTVYAVYYSKNKACKASYAGKVGLYNKCVVREY